MALVRWEDKYLVGDEVIDADHKALFAMINEFYDAFQESQKRRDILVILAKLVRYAEAHFRREEAIMATFDYLLRDEHHLSHTKLYETIYALSHRLESNPAPLDQQTFAFLKSWLVDHVVEEDLQFGEFLRQAKIN